MPSKGKPALGETPGYLGIRLHTHAGHGTSQFVAVDVLGPGQNAKTAQNEKRNGSGECKKIENRQNDAQSFSLRSELSNDCGMSSLDNVALINFYIAK